MLKLNFLFFLLCTKIVFSHQEPKSTFDKMSDGLACVNSGIVIAKTAYLVCKYVHPDEVEQLKQLLIDQQIQIIKTEKELLKCVAKNAYGDREDYELPLACKDAAMLFAECAGLERYYSFTSEFNSIIDDLPLISEKQSKNQGVSTATKIVIGGVITIGATGVFLICSPILLPGTIIAVKASAIAASIKTTAVVAGAKIAVASAATKATIATVATAAVTTVNEAATFYDKSKEKFNKFPVADKVKTIARAIEVAGEIYVPINYVRPYVFENAQEELVRLAQKRAASLSLRERIKEIHFSESK